MTDLEYGRRTLPDGRIVIIYPLTYGRATFTVSTPEQLEIGIMEDSW